MKNDLWSWLDVSGTLCFPNWWFMDENCDGRVINQILINNMKVGKMISCCPILLTRQLSLRVWHCFLIVAVFCGWETKNKEGSSIIWLRVRLGRKSLITQSKINMKFMTIEKTQCGETGSLGLVLRNCSLHLHADVSLLARPPLRPLLPESGRRRCRERPAVSGVVELRHQ